MKSITYLPSLILISLSIFLCNSCNRDCHKNGTCAEDYRRIPLGEAKNYLNALSGSYWIYKHSVTGVLDTQICTSFHCDTIISKGSYKDTKHITVEYEQISRTIISTSFKRIYDEKTNAYNPDVIRPPQAILKRYSDGLIVPFFHPFDLNEISGNGSSLTTCVGIDSVLTIQGKTYFNAARFNIDTDGAWYGSNSGVPVENSHPPTIYYWAKDVGLVKRTNLKENYSWELIEYNIVK
jgi:hypothetical protein